MKEEIVRVVEILDSGELFLKLESGGDPSYQYIYREAAAVYWDNEHKGFKSTKAPGEWTYAAWYDHIVAIVKSSVGAKLVLSSNTQWINVPQEIKSQILQKYRNH
jgi:Integron Cassette Protein Hfx_Cass5